MQNNSLCDVIFGHGITSIQKPRPFATQKRRRTSQESLAMGWPLGVPHCWTRSTSGHLFGSIIIYVMIMYHIFFPRQCPKYILIPGLVLGTFFYFFIFPYICNNHPNWQLTDILQRGWNHQPDTVIYIQIPYFHPSAALQPFFLWTLCSFRIAKR